MRELPFTMSTGTPKEAWRAETFWSKEPETVAWIDSFTDGFFWDVGANVGIYSLYAAAKHYKRLQVFAFEPYPDNFVALKGNVVANGQAQNITPVLAALGEETGFSYFYVPEPGRGASGGQVKMPVDESGEGFEIRERFLVPTAKGDDLARTMLGPPTYLKIDVDGREREVLLGMRRILSFPGAGLARALRSALVEVNRHKAEIISVFRDAGFTMDNPFNFMDDHSRNRRKREGIAAENIVFTRKA